MTQESINDDALRLSRRFVWAGVIAVVSSVLLAVAAAVAPIGPPPGHGMRSGTQSVPALDPVQKDWNDLVVQVAGSRLIRPVQIQAAVLDSGAAQRLLSRLRLQSVVQIDGAAVAYVRVRDEGVQAVREGGRLLDFMVEAVEPGNVRLSLDGVQVHLGY
jgi:hypothetical protein